MDLNTLPSIDGVAWRTFRPGDYDDITRLLNEDLKVGGHGTSSTVEDVRTNYQRDERLDEGRDILIAEAGGGVVGHVSVFTWKELAGSRILFHAGRVTPAWKHHGIGTGMLHWAQGRLDEMSGDPGEDTITRTTAVSAATTEFMTKNGYQVTEHEAILVRPDLDDIPDVPLPEGVEVRPVDEADLRMIYEAEVEHFRDHWGASEEESGWWESWKSDPHRDLSLWQVAFAGDQVVGIVRPHILAEENEQMGPQARVHRGHLNQPRLAGEGCRHRLDRQGIGSAARSRPRGNGALRPRREPPRCLSPLREHGVRAAQPLRHVGAHRELSADLNGGLPDTLAPW